MRLKIGNNSSVEKIFVTSIEVSVILQIIVVKIIREGPFQKIVFNHGSIGRGYNEAVYTSTNSPFRPMALGLKRKNLDRAERV